MVLGVIEQILEKFSINLSEKVISILIQHLEFLYNIIKESYEFSSGFNKQLDLRQSLWKEGFIP
jgi:predicted transcriptional regulator